ncbi:MAG: HD domain-containing protein, partial [Chloroflexaceae bacterium]|nr:HD domain-containing protein [Chloroflexaceae bacterium]
QLDDHFTRSSGGLGLGLSIVRRTLDQLGGTIQVQSQPDVGTAFEVQLPHHQPLPGNEVQQLRVRLDASHQQTQQYARDLQQLYGELQQHWLATLNSITEALEARDIYTRGHTDRVTALALRLARHMGYSDGDLQLLEIAGRIHDIGMIGIPDTILNKTGSLSEVEKAIARQHVVLGRKIVEPLDFLHDAAQIAFAHHERWDGQGYPDGLAGETIPHAARILAVADAFDAITSPRAYREARSPQQALEIIRAGAGQQWDASVVQALLEVKAEG